MILELIEETVAAGARLRAACNALGIDVRTVQRWRACGGNDGRAGPKMVPKNKLSKRERAEVLQIMNLPENRDLSPKQVVPKLADAGIYLASESTIYRILREEDQLARRGRARAPMKRHRPRELVARGPNEVWSWDITYLQSPVRGTFYYLYMIVDVWSRKVVGHAVHLEESSTNAAEMIEAACVLEGVSRDELVIHSDNGSPMKGATLVATLRELGVIPSYSRPSVSNDNPFSESLFRTVKYRPGYPSGPFQSLEAASAWVDTFVAWYNTKHHHSAIKWVTPLERHERRHVGILERRKAVYEKARANRPDRWARATRNWTPEEKVALNPAPETPTEAA